MHPLQKIARERILILDGAMGSMLQDYRLDEAGYRGARFANWDHPLKGNNDLLNLSQPQIVEEIVAALDHVVAGTPLLVERIVDSAKQIKAPMCPTQGRPHPMTAV